MTEEKKASLQSMIGKESNEASALSKSDARKVLVLLLKFLEELKAGGDVVDFVKAVIQDKGNTNSLTYIDLQSLIKTNPSKIGHPDNGAKKKVQGYLKRILKIIKDNNISFIQKLAENDIPYMPELAYRIDRPRSSQHIMFIKGSEIKEADRNFLSQGVVKDETHIAYKVSKVSKMPVWAKPFRAISLSGYRIYLYILIPSLFIVTFAALSQWVFKLNGPLGDKMIILFFGVFLILIIWEIPKPFFKLAFTRVITAPFWLLPTAMINAQLVMRPIDTDNPDTAREIVLLRFTGDCPVCRSTVEIVKGTKEFKGRMIGQCDESPNEHVYSFDHVSKAGVPLRTNGYYEKIIESPAE